jgi:hypothetical protein
MKIEMITLPPKESCTGHHQKEREEDVKGGGRRRDVHIN